MIRFPKRLHRGETPTAFGRKVCVATLNGLDRSLHVFNEIPRT